jgi:nitrogen regulatory protein P-II 2
LRLSRSLSSIALKSRVFANVSIQNGAEAALEYGPSTVFAQFRRGMFSAPRQQRHSWTFPRIRAPEVPAAYGLRLDRCEIHIMKMITAVVRPFKLDELRQAIAQLGVQGVTITEVYEAQFGPRTKVEIAVDDAIVEPVLEAIANVSRTGRTGDGRILVGELEQAIRIRTGETGTAAT